MLVVVGAMLDSQRDRNGGEAAIRSAAEPGRTVSSGSGRMQPLRGMARELGVVAFAAAAYGAVRAVTEGSVAQAVANAEAVSRIEHTLGIGWEQSVQSLVIGSTALVTLVNWIYIWGHWPVIIAAATFLYVRRPTHYRILAKRDHHVRADRVPLLLRDAHGAAAPRRPRGLRTRCSSTPTPTALCSRRR